MSEMGGLPPDFASAMMWDRIAGWLTVSISMAGLSISLGIHDPSRSLRNGRIPMLRVAVFLIAALASGTALAACDPKAVHASGDGCWDWPELGDYDRFTPNSVANCFYGTQPDGACSPKREMAEAKPQMTGVEVRRLLDAEIDTMRALGLIK
jgi:hypothetical protein